MLTLWRRKFFINKYALRGHKRSHKVILNVQNHLFLLYNFCLTPNLFKTLQECQQYDAANFVNGPILIKFVWMLLSWRYSIWPEISLLYYGEVLWFIYFWPNYNLDLRSYGQHLSLFRHNQQNHTMSTFVKVNFTGVFLSMIILLYLAAKVLLHFHSHWQITSTFF